jgi:hypothetical protein
MKLGAIIGPWLQIPSTPQPVAREGQGTVSTLKEPAVSPVAPPTEAMRWLAERLTFPCRIAPLIREWCGRRDGDGGHWIKDLNKARAEMGVIAYEEEDGMWWWRLPESEPDVMAAEERAAIEEEDKG